MLLSVSVWATAPIGFAGCDVILGNPHLSLPLASLSIYASTMHNSGTNQPTSVSARGVLEILLG